MDREQRNRLVRSQSIIWTFLILLSMAVSFAAGMSAAGALPWLEPRLLLFCLLGTLVLVATQFSLTLGGGMTKAERDAARERGE